MAAKKKPAIANVARPQGFIDDVIYPIAQKAARKVGNVSFTSNLPRKARTKISRAASKLESGVAQKRMSSYSRKTNKYSAKLDKALEENKFRAANKYARKTNVNWEKADELHSSGRNVRKAAQRARKEMRKR